MFSPTKAHTDLTHAELVTIFSTPYMSLRKEELARAVGSERMKAVMEEVCASRQGIPVVEYRNRQQQIAQQRIADEAAAAARRAARTQPRPNPVRRAVSRMAVAVANLI